jgi:anti-anti-sigma factor
VAGTSTFRIDRTRTDARQTLAPNGELDSGSYPALIEAFERAAAETDGDELHLDLRGLSFIDSAGLRAIIQLERTARERSLMLVVTPPPAPLTELLHLTGLTDRLTLTAHQEQPPEFKPFVERVEFDLPSELATPGRARIEIRQAARERLDDATLDAAVLLTSELVTNAVIHPATAEGGAVRLRITCYEDAVRCEISDRGPGFDPSDLGRRTRTTGGRGLLLVDALASRWGIERVPDDGAERFCVWFELEAGSADARGASGTAAADAPA